MNENEKENEHHNFSGSKLSEDNCCKYKNYGFASSNRDGNSVLVVANEKRVRRETREE